MSVAELLGTLAAAGVQLRADGDRLVVNAPKGSLSSDIAGRIKAHKTEILEVLSELGSSARSEEEPIRPMGEGATGTLSIGQNRLWLVEQMHPDTAAHNLPGTWSLTGKMDVEAMAGAALDFVRRHPMLRTCFEVHDGRPRTVTSEKVEARIDHHDLSVLPAGERDAALQVWLEDVGRRPFDLGRGPMFRFHLARLGDEQHVVCIVAHAIIWDGWSFDLFLEEMGALYEARLARKPPALPELPLRYGDFAAWQQRHAKTAQAKADLDYWTKHLAGNLSALDLPTDRPRKGNASARGSRENFAMTADVSRELYAFARSEGVTPFMVLFAAYAALLGRYAHTDDVVITTPMQGRRRRELERIIGPFTNSIFLRVRLNGNPTFRELVQRARETVLEGFAHQTTPVEALLDALRQDLTSTSLFQVDFSYQNTQQRTTRWGPLVLGQVPQDFHATHADLNFWVRDAGASLSGAFDYRTDLFDRETLRRLIDHLLHVVALGIRSPDTRLGDLAFDSDDVVHRMRSSRVGDTLPEQGEGCLSAIARLARSAPRTPALVWKNGALDFAALASAAARTSESLRAIGVRAGDRVGACISDPVEAVVSVLASWHAGAVWVPLDPRESPVRTRHAVKALELRAAIVDDVGARVVSGAIPTASVTLTGEPMDLDPARQPELDSDAILLLDTASPEVAAGHVTFSHAAVAAAVASHSALHPLGSEDRVFVALPFDDEARIPALLAPLCAGASLHVASTDDDEHATMELVARARPTMLEVDVDLLAALLALSPTGALAKKIVVSAPALSRELAADLLARGCSVSTRTGAPSTLGVGAAHDVRAAEDATLLGRPVPGATLRVVDAHGHEVPLGVEGELVVSGPFSGAISGAISGTLKRSGNGVRARWTGSGSLEHRPRGARARHATIERVLSSLEGVSGCHVDLRGDPRVLVAWVVPAPDVAPTQTQIREAARPLLPAAWLPRLVIFVDRIPITKRGLVDDRELYDPFGANATKRFEAPSEGLERMLAATWSEVLGIEGISAHDNFFELGGTSLLALKVLAEAQKRTGWAFSPRLLFFQSLRQIAMQAPPEARSLTGRNG